jgi:Holliday junction resolvase RusA-like endonuclease
MIVNINPLSANKCWQGRRYKTQAYKDYEDELMFILPPKKISKTAKLKLILKVGFSNKLSDLDNCQKPFIDILQKKYGFNDNQVYKIEAEKIIVPKGEEFIEFDILEI